MITKLRGEHFNIKEREKSIRDGKESNKYRNQVTDFLHIRTNICTFSQEKDNFVNVPYLKWCQSQLHEMSDVDEVKFIKLRKNKFMGITQVECAIFKKKRGKV